MRLFFAIFPDTETLAKIRNRIRQLDKIKRNFYFVPYDQMHLTLKFVGANVSEGTAAEIASSLKSLEGTLSKVEINLDRLMYGFPGQQYPNVMFFSVNSNKKLDLLSEHINELVKNVDLPDTIKRKDRKRVFHHLTIGRTKRSVSRSLTRKTREFIDSTKAEEISFEADELYLMESILTPTGPVYRKLDKIKLT